MLNDYLLQNLGVIVGRILKRCLKVSVKLFDENHERDLENSINEFLKDNNCDIIDIKYQVAIAMYGEDQIYCFSAMIVYEEK